MSSYAVHAAPVKVPFLTRGTAIVAAIAAVGMGALAWRFIFGIGAVTNLDDQYPWGLWIAIDVACGVALAAGGFTTALLAEIFHRDKYHSIVRPALLTAMLGYTFVAIGVATDLGRYYNIWHPILPSMWQGNSVLFEVGMCVTIYVTVLYLEFMPIVVERFKGKVALPGPLARFNGLIEWGLNLAERTVVRFAFIFIIAGVVLSCLHQSSLGTLMLIAPTKVHALWFTPISPLLFLLSAIAVGFPMVIFESIVAHRSFRMKVDTGLLASLARYTPIILGVYLAIKIGDMAIRETFTYLLPLSTESVMWMLEIGLGVVAPMLILMSRLRRTVGGLFAGAFLVILGVVINRVNVFIIAYTPPYADSPYVPTIGEFMVTFGFIALLVLLYRAFAMIFPVISHHGDHAAAPQSIASKGEDHVSTNVAGGSAAGSAVRHRHS